MRAEIVTMPAGGGRLAAIRAASERALLGVIALHGPGLGLTGWLLGGPVALPLLSWLAVAAAVGLIYLVRPHKATCRAAIGAGLCLMPALLVEQLSGHPWQDDAQMYFFAVLAVTAAMLDLGAVLAGAAAIALHPLVMDFARPGVAFPGAADLGRVAFHALIVAFEAGALAWLLRRAAQAIVQAEKAGSETARLALERADEEAGAELRAAAERRETVHAMADELERSLTAIAEMLAHSAVELSASADALASFAGRAAAEAEEAAADAQATGAGLRTVAAASEEMMATVHEITRRMNESAGVVANAVGEVEATNAVVLELSDDAQRIGDAVQLIGRIAARTSLLALGVPLEAGDAGEAGNGFGAVASEVRMLAGQTAKAVEEIGIQVQRMQHATGHAVCAIGGIGATLEWTGEILAGIAAAAEQQSAATRGISLATREVAAGTERVTCSVAGISAAVAETSVAVDKVRASSTDVARQGAELRSEIRTVTRRLRRHGEAA